MPDAEHPELSLEEKLEVREAQRLKAACERDFLMAKESMILAQTWWRKLKAELEARHGAALNDDTLELTRKVRRIGGMNETKHESSTDFIALDSDYGVGVSAKRSAAADADGTADRGTRVG